MPWLAEDGADSKLLKLIFLQNFEQTRDNNLLLFNQT